MTHDSLITRTVIEPGETTCVSDPEPGSYYGGSEWTAHRYVQQHFYDLAGRRDSTKGPFSLSGCATSPCTTKWTYAGGAGELTKVKSGLGDSVYFAHDYASRLYSIMYPGSVEDVRTFDSHGQLVRRTIDGGAFLDDTLSHDAAGRIKRAMQSVAGDETFNWYGPLGAVVKVQGATRSATGNPVLERLFRTDSVKYTMDGLGNRSYIKRENIRDSEHPDEHGERYTSYDAARRIVLDSAKSVEGFWHYRMVTYDASGNVSLTKVYEGDAGSNTVIDAQYSYYDAGEKLRVFNRVVGPTAQDDSHPGQRNVYEEYRYDALGRRILTRTRRAGTCSASYAECVSRVERTVWDGDQVVYEIRAKGGPARPLRRSRSTTPP